MNKTSAITLSIGFVIASIILALGISKLKRQNNYVTVKGLSEKEVLADKAWWSLNTQINANSTEEMQNRIATLESQLKSFFIEHGFTEDELNTPSLNVYQNNYKEATSRLNGDYKLSVTTDNISKVRSAAKATGDLISKGILLQSDQWGAGPKYYFTKFKELKKEMLAEATKEAKEAAQEFATNSGSNVGKIRRANQGVFQILPGNRTQENEVFFPEKIIRVVSTVDYFLD